MHQAPTSDRVVFSGAVEAIGRLVQERSPGQLSHLGVAFSRLEPAYPVDVWAALIRKTSALLFPNELAPEAEYLVGRHALLHYAQTLMGGAMFSVLRVIGPARAIHRVGRAFRTSNNYSVAETTALGPTAYVVTMNEVHTPFLYRGTIESTLTEIGASQCRVRVVSMGEATTEYHCEG
ncbi:MAG: DUF2378 family protein [Myxococcaceae bacterium]|nr:DUF2378 family protein [Myxococcaceae bacterium]